MKTYDELLEHEKPEYKIKNKGAQSLKDNELLVTILNASFQNQGEDVRRVANKIISGSYSDAHEAFMEIKRRGSLHNEVKITSSEKIYELLKHDIGNKKQENFVVITIDGASHVIAKRTIFVGTLNQSLVHPREVFADAIADRAAGIIIAHNHPSGTLNPSRADIAITQRLDEVSKLVGIELLDHVIVTKNEYYSFSDEGML